MSKRFRAMIAGSDGVGELVKEAPREDGAPAGEPDLPEPRLGRESRLDLLVGAFVLVAYLLVQLWFLQGPRPLDTAKYFDTAVDFPNVPIDLWTLRVGLIAPVRVAVLTFGPSEAALYAVPVAAGLLLAAAVYGTMLVLFRDRVLAAATALVTVLNTSFLFTSSFIYPDTTATATLTAGFFFLVLAGIRAQRGDEGWLPPAAAAAAGFLFGSSYLIREFSPLLLPGVIVALVLLSFPVRRVALVAGAAVATGSLELLYGALRWGEPFRHVQELLDRNTTSFTRSRALRMDYIQSQLENPLDTMLVLPRLLLSWRTGWFFLLVVGIFLVALFLVRDRRFWLLAAWCLPFWATMVVLGLGELPSGRWILNVTNIRYWYPMLPGLVMAGFGGLWLLRERWLPGVRGVRIAQVGAASLAALVLLPGWAEFKRCSDRKAWWNDPAERWEDLRSWLSTPEAAGFDALWTDRLTHRLVPAYRATTFGSVLWDGDVETFSVRGGIRPTTDPAETVILVHKERLRSMAGAERRLEALDPEWSPVFTTGDDEMIVLAHESAPLTPSVPEGSEWWELSGRTFERAEFGSCGRSPYENRS